MRWRIDWSAAVFGLLMCVLATLVPVLIGMVSDLRKENALLRDSYNVVCEDNQVLVDELEAVYLEEEE